MDKPILAAHEPKLVLLKEGESRYWCACGRSDAQPFCDGSHKGTTDITPLLFTPDETGDKALCMCKQTTTPPYCDGTHNSLAP